MGERRCLVCNSRLVHNTFRGWSCRFCRAYPEMAEFLRGKE